MVDPPDAHTGVHLLLLVVLVLLVALVLLAPLIVILDLILILILDPVVSLILVALPILAFIGILSSTRGPSLDGLNNPPGEMPRTLTRASQQVSANGR